MLHADHLLKPNSKKIGLFVVWDIFNPSLKFLNSYSAGGIAQIIWEKETKDNRNKNLINNFIVIF